jgi:transcriptional regulator with XRE-family HTH domain
MLTEQQRRRLRRAPLNGPNKVALAMDLVQPKVTQIQLAAALHMTQPTVSRVRNGKYERLPGETMRAFAGFFACSIEDLFPARDRERIAS